MLYVDNLKIYRNILKKVVEDSKALQIDINAVQQ